MKKMILCAVVMILGAVSGMEIPLKNGEFRSTDGKILNWLIVQKNGTVEAVPYKDGKFAVKISSSEPSHYFGIRQGVDIKLIPRTKPGESLRFVLSCRQKSEEVLDGGFVNFTFYSKKGYLIGRDTRKINGTFDWGDVEATAVFPEFPPEARWFSVHLYLGKTTGTVFFAEPKLRVDVIQKK